MPVKIFVFACLSWVSMCFAVTPEKAYELSQSGKALIVDVREFEEISQGMIKDAVWFPKSKMSQDAESIESFKRIVSGKDVFLYCKSGKRAAECTGILLDHGIKAESIGGYDQLKKTLPTEGLHQKLLKLRESSESMSGRENK